MGGWIRIGFAALVTGTVASVSTAVLALLATGERKGDLQPTNATSQWSGWTATRRRGHTELGLWLGAFAQHYNQ